MKLTGPYHIYRNGPDGTPRTDTPERAALPPQEGLTDADPEQRSELIRKRSVRDRAIWTNKLFTLTANVENPLHSVSAAGTAATHPSQALPSPQASQASSPAAPGSCEALPSGDGDDAPSSHGQTEQMPSHRASGAGSSATGSAPDAERSGEESRPPDSRSSVNEDRASVRAGPLRQRPHSMTEAIPGQVTREPLQFTPEQADARENPEKYVSGRSASAIYRYTENSTRINTPLRQGGELNLRVQSDVAAIREGLQDLRQAQGPQRQVIYRGIPFFKSRFPRYDETGKEVVVPHPSDQFEEGHRYIDPAFQSYSRSREVAKQKATSMTKGQGTLVTALTEQATDVSRLSASPAEQEELTDIATDLTTRWKYYDDEEQLHQEFVLDTPLAQATEEPRAQGEDEAGDSGPRRHSI